MLHRSTSVAQNGAQWHRARHGATSWPSDAAAGAGGGKRSRLKSRATITAAVLALAVVYSFAIFNAGMQAAQHTEAQGGILPGKRHRKLEHNGGAQLQTQQAVLAAAKEEVQQQLQQVQQQQLQGATGVEQQQQQQGQDSANELNVQLGIATDPGEQQQQPQQEQGQQPQDKQPLPSPPSQESDQAESKLAAAEDAAGSGEEEAQGTAGAVAEDAASGSEQNDAAGGTQGAAAVAPAAASGPARAAGQQSDNSTAGELESGGSGRRKSPYQRALENCQTLACLKEAAKQKRYRGQFLFPHFLIIGWQKCATTSLFHHLKDHPAVLTPSEKEPEFFSYDCQYDPEACPLEMQKEYIEETLHLNRVLRHNTYRLAFEGSTHYAREGVRMAKGLRRVFPWVKLIASMREPISRYLSMLGHNLDKNTYTCLRKHDLFECLELELPWNNYTAPFMAWLEAYPPEQIMLLQYESLTAPEYEKQHLQAVKTFLGLDPALPASAELPHSNTRAARLGQEPEGWTMERWQYERLVEIVRPDAQSIANIVTQYGFGDGQVWMANWEAAWQANLDACGPDGKCTIH
ncbi:hypothetical protein ABPG77_004418 [Micractinium sp. CCAP 211/92]